MHARPNRRARGPIAAVLAGLLVVACGGGGSADPTSPAAPDPGLAAALVPTDEAALVADWRARLKAGRTAAAGADAFALSGTAVRAAAGTLQAATGTSTPMASTTVVQEAGVDEDDVVRVDDGTAWALTPPLADGAQRLRAHRVAAGGTRLDAAGELALDPALRFDGLFVDAPRARLVLVARRGGAGDVGAAAIPPVGTFATGPCCAAVATATVLWIVSADPTAPRRLHAIEFDGEPVATRRVDGTLWVVTRHRPTFEGFDWSWSDPSVNQRWLDALRGDAVLPRRLVDGRAAGPAVAAGACLAQPASPAPGATLTTVLAVDLADPLAAPRARCVASAVDTVHLTPESLVLATTRWPSAGMPVPVAAASGVAQVLRPGEPVTDLHRFALGSGAIEYRGSGSVPGTLGGSAADAARFALSADGRWLRVLTQRDRWAAPDASPARLTVLEDRGDGLLTMVATLPNERRPAPIGKPGEQVHGVRFVGARGYAVTFRRTDPLFVLDLADPRDPRLLGALEVPGFADRLYPLSADLLLGVGHDTVEFGGIDLRTGVLVTLIDVSDPARPRERARRVIGGAGSRSAVDTSPHGAMLRAVAGRWRIALPVAEHSGPPLDDGATPPAAARWRAFSRLAAFRFEVDPATPALVERGPIDAPGAATVGTLPWATRDPVAAAFDRALDVGDTAWLWYDGRYVGAPW
ncbi:MAG: hypothetical protein RJA99_1741 [Pseudomonadota bacterium]|jgi:hypothetical protein